MEKTGRDDIQETRCQSPPVIADPTPLETPVKKPWWASIREPGSAFQIVVAAIMAIAIGLTVTSHVDEVPEAARAILGIPGVLWLRSLRAVVLPLIVTAMILAVQRLKKMTKGGPVLAKWTITYFLATTFIAIFHSALLTGLVWSKLMTIADEASLSTDGISSQSETISKNGGESTVHGVVVQMFESFIPQNVVFALANDSLLAIVITSIIVGYLLKPGSAILRVVQEIESIIVVVITFLIKLAPIGVFFLILPNLFRLDISDVGFNLAILIAGSLSMMALHTFIILPAIYLFVVRKNPWSYWFKNSKAWITAWGTASSAATLPVTIKCCLDRGNPDTVVKFLVPLGTAIYFPIVVVFLAATQGHILSAVDYIIICLLSTLASIGVAPIPSASLVLTVMIANSINVPVTGMFAVVVAIDWFLDRFRTALNVSGDLFAAAVVTKITGMKEIIEEDTSSESDYNRVDEPIARSPNQV
ncbi:related to excitatory amino acid transporter [Rhynchosporium secalis]|uniref:Amino acid transporter n=1 Tax=Rhynchosporium secalis TaxID=38038 RepID=A0A1E1M3B5_RHYSE|nr:related to excitatory amino acid transporter [Rhynchosporium secalis]